MIAATPPFATKESAADEAVEEEAGVVAVPEVAAGEEAVDPPLVAGYAGMDPLAPDPLAPVDAEGATEPLAPVSGILLGVALPVALRPTVKKKKTCIEQKKRKN